MPAEEKPPETPHAVDPTTGVSLKRRVRILFSTVALLFLIFAALDLFEKWDRTPVHLQTEWFLVALLFASAAMCVQWLAWRALIHSWTGLKMPWAGSAKLYLDSQMARYTPGKIGLPAVRITGASGVGVPPRVMGGALLAEVFSWCAAGIFVGLGLVALSPAAARVSSLSFGFAPLGALFAILALLAGTFLDRRKLPTQVRALLGVEGAGALIPKRVPFLHGIHFLLWAACGSCLCLCAGGEPQAAWTLGGLLCLAIVFGFLALLAPAGVGVREGIMIAGASSLIGPSAAVAIGLLARAASLISDTLLWAASRIWSRVGA